MIATVGGSQGLYGAFQCVLDPGDDVLVFSPYWTPIADLITGAQARPLRVPTSTARRNGIRNTLTQFSTPKTRAIYYNTPQNPSGLVFTRAEAEEVAAFAIERDLIVIADEAYEDLVYDGEHVSIASLPGMAERTITCFTFSKTYAMTGWRAGYAVAQEPFMTALRKIVLYSTNGVATPVQYAMIHALKTPESRSLGFARSIASAAICWSPASMTWAWSAHRRREPSTRFPTRKRSTKTAGQPRKFCLRRPTSPLFRAPSLALKARAICALATQSL